MGYGKIGRWRLDRRIDTGWLPREPWYRRWSPMSAWCCALEHILAWWCGVTLSYPRHNPFGTLPRGCAGEVTFPSLHVDLYGPACKFRVASMCHELGHVEDFRAGVVMLPVPTRFSPERATIEFSAWLHARKRLIALGLWDSHVREFAHECLELGYGITRRLPL